MGRALRVDTHPVEARAESGEADAQFNLGLMYSTGQRVAQDYITAHKWFNLAALAGKSEAADHRQDLAIEMTGEEIASAQRAAREWMTRH